MKVSKFNPSGGKSCNIYIIGEEGQPCIIVDPGSNDNGFIDRYVDNHHDGKIAAILLTHGHYDHITGLVTLKHKAQVMCHQDEAEFLIEPRYNGTGWHEELEDIVLDDVKPCLLNDQENIRINDLDFKVIHTPFHTRGSVCFYLEKEKTLFSGDTLFHLAIGRTDLPTGSDRTIESSLKKLATLPDDVKVFPGHGTATTIGFERTHNPFMMDACRQ